MIREYNIPLVRSGRGYKALCPFHAEKTPSFHINVEGQYFHCFGCEERGDLFAFVQKIEHLDFVQAVELLARRAGVELAGGTRRRPDGGRGPGQAESRENIVGMYDALKFARDFYHQFLLRQPGAHAAREYLLGRGIELPAWEEFGLGFSPPEGKTLLSAALKKEFSPQILAAAGLVRASHPERSGSGGYFDYFRGRIMFPIANAQKRTVGFGARVLNGAAAERGPKYLNTPKTAVFDKASLLYGLAESRETIHREERVAVVEGYTDVIMAHQVGLKYFVASLGTAFTAENARQLSRLKMRLWMVFDGDGAGQKAAERSLELLVPEDLDVRVFTVPDGADPCEAVRTMGAEAFQSRMEKESVGLFEFKWRRTVATASDQEAGPVVKGRALDDCLRLLARVPNAITQKLFLREFSERIGVDEKEVVRRFRKLSRSSRVEARPRDAVGAAERSSATQPQPGARELERVILECVMALPHNAAEIWKRVPEDLFQDDASRELCAAIERHLERGELSPERLVREVQDRDAQERLIEILSRVRPDEDEGLGWRQPTDYDEVWGYAQVDIERHLRLREIDRITREMECARLEGDSGTYRELICARLGAKKKLKLMKRSDEGRVGE